MWASLSGSTGRQETIAGPWGATPAPWPDQEGDLPASTVARGQSPPGVLCLLTPTALVPTKPAGHMSSSVQWGPQGRLSHTPVLSESAHYVVLTPEGL